MFGKMKKGRLEEECEERNINHHGLTRKAMIATLEEYEKNGPEGEEEEAETEEEVGGDQMKLELIRAEKERMQVEMELLQTKAQLGLLQSSASVAATEISTPSTYTKLPNMTEGEDPAAFFLSFEKVACLQGIDESKWARILPSLLNSQMRLHFNRLPMETCTDYRQTKTALMHACRMNAKHYLERFKTMHRSGKQTYAQLLENLKDTFDYYLECKGVNDFISLKDDIILERLRESLAPETRYFVEARKPKTSVELANYADLQFECAIEGRMQAKRDHRPAQKFKSQGAETTESQWGGKPPFNREAQGYKPLEREQGARPMHSWQGSHPQGTGHSYRGNASKINSYGHAHVRFVKPKTKLERVIEYQRQFTIPVYVNGTLINALRDSGSQCTLIDAELARGNSSAMNGDPITVQCAFGTVKCFATCLVQISSPNFGTDREITVKAGIIPGLGVKMLIGHDIFVENGDLKDLVAPNKCAMDDDEKPQHAQSLIATRQHDYNDSGPRRGRDEDGSRPVPRRGGVETSPTADELAELRPRERGSKAQVVKPDDDHGATREAPIVDATPAVIEINHRKGPDVVNDLNDPNEINDQARQSSEDARRQGSHKQDHRRTEVQRAAADATSANNNETQHVSAEEENQMIDGVCGRDQEGDHTRCENGGHQTKSTDAADEFSDSDDHQAAPTEADDENQMVENGDILINDETESFKQAQITDQTLSDLWTAAKEGNGRYKIDGGLLYKQSNGKETEEGTETRDKLLLPISYRQKVLKLAHDSPWAGHRGIKATTARIAKAFCWPSMTSDIQDYVRTCPECQKTAIVKTAERVPLVEVPVIDEPWNKIVMDVLGPISPKSSSGKSFVLIIVEQATHWPEFRSEERRVGKG